MRAVTRGLAVLALSGAFAVSGAPSALAAPCPVGTYPPGQDCTVTDTGTTDGQPVSGGTTGSSATGGSSSGGSSSGGSSTGGSSSGGSTTPEPGVVVVEPAPVTSPSPAATTAPGSGTQASGTPAEDGLSTTALAFIGAGGTLGLALLLVLFALRRRNNEDAQTV